MRLSIVVPVLNEAAGVASHLAALGPLRARGAELIVADGGGSDGTPERARPHCDRLVEAPRGRASQMNAGAAAASGDILLFLHADTILPEDADARVRAALSDGDGAPAWGRFDVRISGRHPGLAIVARAMNLRSRLTGIATGDQAMFVRADVFRRLGGFPDQPLMEDIAFSTALLRVSRPACLRDRVITSGRRWETHGVARTILTMWRLRLAYRLGADPRDLAIQYGYRPRDV